MPTKKLHELIKLAKEGKQFIAKTSFSVPLKEKSFLQKEPWSESFITADWEYQETREPEVVEFDLTVNDSGFFEWHQPEASIKLNGKKWTVVCTEVMDD